MYNRVFVTGASGFLGTWVVRRLLRRFDEVHALVLPGDPLARFIPEGVIKSFGDITDKEQVDAWLSDADGDSCVIHCTGMISLTSKPNRMMEAVNVGGTRNVVDSCLKRGVAKLVHISSVHAIPEKPNGQVQEEVSSFDPKLVSGQYAKTKAAATQYVLDASKKGLNVSVVHPSGIIGPCDYGVGNITRMIMSYMNGTLSAGVKGGYDFVDVRDVADGILLAAEKGKSGECYILSGSYKSIREMLTEVRNDTGKKRVPYCVSLGLAKAVAPFFERRSIRRKEKPFFTPYSVEVLGTNGNFSHLKASLGLGYSPRRFSATIKDTVEWLRESKRGYVCQFQ